MLQVINGTRKERKAKILKNLNVYINFANQQFTLIIQIKEQLDHICLSSLSIIFFLL